MTSKSPTEGEEIISIYLTDNDIKFKREVEIGGLDGDYAHYRTADFYLPQYKTFIEFFGRWNTERGREEYKQKQKIYEKNKIPCVYLYPDNLGVLDFIFKRRLGGELIKHNLKWQLFKYNFKIFREEEGSMIIVFGVLIYYIPSLSAKVIVFLLLVYNLFKSVRKHFKKVV
ncbi:MAG: hypothetical protein AABW46_01390 [Nanoarchaeota archaeon]